jgi:hypothetical protein
MDVLANDAQHLRHLGRSNEIPRHPCTVVDGRLLYGRWWTTVH